MRSYIQSALLYSKHSGNVVYHYFWCCSIIFKWVLHICIFCIFCLKCLSPQSLPPPEYPPLLQDPSQSHLLREVFLPRSQESELAGPSLCSHDILFLLLYPIPHCTVFNSLLSRPREILRLELGLFSLSLPSLVHGPGYYRCSKNAS